MKLRYIGPRGPDTTLPLPEGWPAVDHDEPDETVAEAKVASGYYSVREKRQSRGVMKDASDQVTA